MNDFAQTHRRLAVLVEVASGESVTQRSLAGSLGISLGLANKLLHQLQRERMIKVQSADNGERYAVTRLGRTGMAKCAKAFAARANELAHRAEDILDVPPVEKRRVR